MAIEEFLAVFKGETGPIVKSIHEVEGKLTDMEAQAAKSHGRLGALIGGVTSVAIKGAAMLGAAITTATAFGVESFTKLEESEAQLGSMGEINAEGVKRIGDAFIATAGQSTFSANEMMAAFAPVSGQFKAMYGDISNADDVMTIMRASMNLAEASGISLTESTASLAAVMQTFQLDLKDASNATDILYNASKAVGVPITDMATAVDKLHSKLGITAPTLGDTSTLITALAEDAGVRGNRGLMVMTAAMESLIQPTKKGAEEIQNLGLRTFDAHGHFAGMASIISQLQPKLKGMDDQHRLLVLTEIFGKGAAEQMNAVIMKGSAAYAEQTAAVNRFGSAHNAAEAKADTFEGSLKRLRAAAVDMADDIGRKVAPYLRQLADWFTAHAPQIKDFVNTAIDVLATAFMTVANYIGQNVVPVLMIVARWFTDNQAVFRTVAGIVGATMVIAWRTLGDVLNAAGSAVKFVSDHFAWFVPILAGVAAGLAVVAANMAIAGIAAVAQAAVEGLYTAFWGLNAALDANPIMIVVVAIAVLIGGLVMAYQHCETFRNIVNTVFNFVRDHIKLVLTIVVGLLTGGLGLAVLWVVTHMTEIKNAIGAAWDWIKQHWKDALEWVFIITVGWAPALLALFLNLLGKLVGFVKDHIGQVAHFFEELPGKILGFLASLPGKLLGVGRDMMGHLWDGIKALWNDISGWFGKVPGWVGGFFKGLPGQLLQIGKDLIEGLLNGLKQAWEHVKSFISDAAGGIVSKFKGILGIGSPSRVFAKLGGNIMAGLHEGLVAAFPRVQQALGGMAADLSPQLGISATLSRATSAIGNAGALFDGGMARLQQGIGAVTAATTNVGGVVVNQPRSELDVVSALERALWLAKFQVRGIAPPPEWAMGA